MHCLQHCAMKRQNVHRLHGMHLRLKGRCTCTGVEPGQLAFMAVHGTGTPLGDPIEISALGQAVSSRLFLSLTASLQIGDPQKLIA